MGEYEMKIQKTSITAYHQEKNRNRTKKQVILWLINHYKSLTDHELMNMTGWPRNIVSSRRNELVKESKVVFDEVVYDLESNKKVISWKPRWTKKTANNNSAEVKHNEVD